MQTARRITTTGICFIWLLAAATAWPAGLFSADSKGSKEPIEITADRLVTNNKEKWADFLGSVKAVQGKFTMTSDALRVFYTGDLMNPPQGERTGSTVEKFVATGRVHIVTDQYTTDSHQAEYVQATDIMTLTGPNSRVVSGGNTITGPRIVLRRSEGTAVVEGAGTERVKAVFTTESKEKGAAGGVKPKGEAAKPAETP